MATHRNELRPTGWLENKIVYIKNLRLNYWVKTPFILVSCDTAGASHPPLRSGNVCVFLARVKRLTTNVAWRAGEWRQHRKRKLIGRRFLHRKRHPTIWLVKWRHWRENPLRVLIGSWVLGLLPQKKVFCFSFNHYISCVAVVSLCSCRESARRRCF